ncbi:MAG TPA: hypothetical protein VFJ82_21270 [Longimicrobium sp.]|nr:hypothetical protein [Longimicrobium sp.]
MDLRPTLLASHSPGWTLPGGADGRVHGQYNPMEYVVRLHPHVQAVLRDHAAEREPGHAGPDVLAAFSTYLHETIHWWQHVGSTAGLMLSLSYPAQTHLNHKPLSTLLAAVGPRKSLRRLDERHGPELGGETRHDLNRVLNNWHDVAHCYAHMVRPHDAPAWDKDPFYHSVGHSYKITWQAGIWLISACFDPGLRVLPDARVWDEEFPRLAERRVMGHYRGSPVPVPPVGAYEIFEGQARFAQLQYLHFTSGGVLDWADFERTGMLDRVYLAAFAHFLATVGHPMPPSVDHPLVGLFLLICDIALNPPEGFPFPIRVYETFLADVDPGSRFHLLCMIVQRLRPDLATAVTAYTRTEYEEVASALCGPMRGPTPLDVAREVCGWPARLPSLRALMEQDARFRFDPANLPVRVFFARFLTLQAHKARHPEFFTWPGAWSIDRGGDGGPTYEEVADILTRNEPLFVDAPDGEVRPRLLRGRAEADVQETFDAFFGWNAAYDLVRQWTVEDGPFRFDFAWLSPGATGEQLRRWASAPFQALFGVDPSEFTIL